MKKSNRGILITAILLLFFIYIVPSILYGFKLRTASFEFLACVFVFFQLILSDEFLNKYNILNHFNLVGQRKYNYSRIQNYRLDVSNLIISFSLAQSQIIFPCFKYLFQKLIISLNSLGSPFSIYFIRAFEFVTFLGLVYLLRGLLEKLEKSIADKMSKLKQL